MRARSARKIGAQKRISKKTKRRYTRPSKCKNPPDAYDLLVEDLREAVHHVEDARVPDKDSFDAEVFANMIVFDSVRAIVETASMGHINLDRAIDAQDTFIEAATAYIPRGWEHLPGLLTRLDEKIFS